MSGLTKLRTLKTQFITCKTKKAFDYEALKKKILEQFRSGKDLFSKGEPSLPLLKDFLEAALQAELDEHLEQQDPEQKNRKNGYNIKLLKTGTGSIELHAPCAVAVTFHLR